MPTHKKSYFTTITHKKKLLPKHLLKKSSSKGPTHQKKLLLNQVLKKELVLKGQLTKKELPKQVRVNDDFADNFYDLAAKFSRLIFNEIAVIF